MAKKRAILVVDTASAIKALSAGEIVIDENPVWSNTRIEVSSRCMKQYALNYLFHVQAKVTPDVARGDLLHKMTPKLWSGWYKSFESFVNCAKRDWKFQYVRTGKSQNSEIEWSSKGQRRGNWYPGQIANLAGMIYSRHLIEEPPLKSELKIENIEVEGIDRESLVFMAILDELRLKRTPEGERIVIRDHKTGGRNYANEIFRDTNTQMTHYALCLYFALKNPKSIVSQISELRRFCSMNLEDFLENLLVEINHVSDYRKQGEDHIPLPQLYPAKRTLGDVRELICTISSRQKAIRSRDFSQNNLRCPACFWNKSCRNFNMQEIFKDEYLSRFPLFANAGIALDSTHKPKIRGKRLQRIFRFTERKRTA